jgi:hypothetical protein
LGGGAGWRVAWREILQERLQVIGDKRRKDKKPATLARAGFVDILLRRATRRRACGRIRACLSRGAGAW